jgi:hypothetical protein
MKFGLIAATLLTSLFLTGCAGNQGTQAQVDALQKRAHSQDEQIAKLKAQSTTAAGSAWDWTSQKAQDAWNSQPSQETRARFQKCWDNLKNGN